MEVIFSTSLSHLQRKYPFKKLVVPCNKPINQLEEKGLSVQKCSQLMINLGTWTLNNRMNKLEQLKSLSLLCKYQEISHQLQRTIMRLEMPHPHHQSCWFQRLRRLVKCSVVVRLDSQSHQEMSHKLYSLSLQVWERYKQLLQLNYQIVILYPLS